MHQDVLGLGMQVSTLKAEVIQEGELPAAKGDIMNDVRHWQMVGLDHRLPEGEQLCWDGTAFRLDEWSRF